jgi:hypothetical protein
MAAALEAEKKLKAGAVAGGAGPAGGRRRLFGPVRGADLAAIAFVAVAALTVGWLILTNSRPW